MIHAGLNSGNVTSRKDKGNDCINIILIFKHLNGYFKNYSTKKYDILYKRCLL